jgi:hypothetical protein
LTTPKEKGTIGASLDMESSMMSARMKRCKLERDGSCWLELGGRSSCFSGVISFARRLLLPRLLLPALAATCACCGGRLLFGTLKLTCLDVCCKCSSPFQCISNLFLDLIKTSSFERAARPVARQQRRDHREFQQGEVDVGYKLQLNDASLPSPFSVMVQSYIMM